MLSEDINIRFYTNPKMINLPIGIQSEVMNIFEDVLNDVKEENPNVTIQQLFSTEFGKSGNGNTEEY